MSNQVTWNKNGNWLVSCSRDQTIKLYDIRTMKDMATFKVRCEVCIMAACAAPFRGEEWVDISYD